MAANYDEELGVNDEEGVLLCAPDRPGRQPLEIALFNQDMWLSSPTAGVRRWTVMDVKGAATPSGKSSLEILEILSALGLQVSRTETRPSSATRCQERADTETKRYVLRRVDTGTLGFLKEQVLAMMPRSPPGHEPVTRTNVLEGELGAVLEDIMRCHICLEAIRTVTQLHPCLHAFDARCLTPWFDRCPRCPLCRRDVVSLSANPILQKLVDEHNALVGNPHPDTEDAEALETAQTALARSRQNLNRSPSARGLATLGRLVTGASQARQMSISPQSARGRASREVMWGRVSVLLVILLILVMLGLVLRGGFGPQAPPLTSSQTRSHQLATILS